VRRKFYDIHVANGSAIASEAVQGIGAVYDIEREIRGKPADLRREIRQARACPLMDDFHRWLNKTLVGLSHKSDTAVAIRYALSRWRALGRFLDDGRIEMDNSAPNAPQPITACSARPSLTDSIRNSTCATCWSALPITPSISSMSCCPGTSSAVVPEHLS
jgi:hypothetical protein